MPQKLERKLKAEARKKFPNDKERQDAYVYGTLRKTGWTPNRRERTKKKAKKSKESKRKKNSSKNKKEPVKTSGPDWGTWPS